MVKQYLIYMDICCFNRPFDDWTQPRIRLEAEAILTIIERCQLDLWKLITSTALESEIDQTPDPLRRQQVRDSLTLSQAKILVTPEIIQRITDLQPLSFKPFDALHLACAETANVDVFLTTDDRLLRKASTHQD